MEYLGSRYSAGATGKVTYELSRSVEAEDRIIING